MKQGIVYEAQVKFVNNVRHVWHNISGKTHQNGQELAIEAVGKGSRKEEDSKAGMKACSKQRVLVWRFFWEGWCLRFYSCYSFLDLWCYTFQSKIDWLPFTN